MDAELTAVIDEITVDCHDEDEQLSAFENAFYDATRRSRAAVSSSARRSMSSRLALRTGGASWSPPVSALGAAYEVALLDIAIDADEDTARLIAAYRQWVRGFG